MTKQPKDGAKKTSAAKKPRISKETVKDLEVGSAGQDVKGGTTRRVGAQDKAGRFC